MGRISYTFHEGRPSNPCNPWNSNAHSALGTLMLLGGFALLLTGALARGGPRQEPQKPEARSPEDIKAEETFTRNCVKCHPADRVVGSRRTRTQWEEVMTTMQTARGAVIADEDWDVMQNLPGEAPRPRQREPRHRRRARRGAGRHAGSGRRLSSSTARSTGTSRTSTRLPRCRAWIWKSSKSCATPFRSDASAGPTPGLKTRASHEVRNRGRRGGAPLSCGPGSSDPGKTGDICMREA